MATEVRVPKLNNLQQECRRHTKKGDGKCVLQVKIKNLTSKLWEEACGRKKHIKKQCRQKGRNQQL